MVVNKVHYARDEKAFLPHGSAVRVGPVNFYFLLPPEPGQEVGAPIIPISSSDDEDNGSEAGAGGSDDEGGTAACPSAAGTGTTSRAPAGPRPRRGAPALGGPRRGGGGMGKVTYSDLVFKAFASAELRETARALGLTSADVTAWIIQKRVVV